MVPVILDLGGMRVEEKDDRAALEARADDIAAPSAVGRERQVRWPGYAMALLFLEYVAARAILGVALSQWLAVAAGLLGVAAGAGTTPSWESS